MAKPLTSAEALRRLADLCVRAERCEYELLQKLATWQISGEEARNVMDYLRSHKFVDDNRFALAFARDKLKFAHWGPRKIRQALYVKRISRGIIDEALEALDPAECQDALNHVIKQKATSNPELLDSFEGRTKLFRFAAQRGFDTASISQAIKAMMR